MREETLTHRGLTLFNFIKKVLSFFNYKFSLIGATFMGLVVYYINAFHGFMPATLAATKQFLYTFFVGGLILKLLDYLLKRLAHNFQGVLIAVLLNSMVTILLVYFVHSLKGTPEPFYSTMPTIILAPFGFFGVAFQKGYLSKENLDLKKAS